MRPRGKTAASPTVLFGASSSALVWSKERGAYLENPAIAGWRLTAAAPASTSVPLAWTKQPGGWVLTAHAPVVASWFAMAFDVLAGNTRSLTWSKARGAFPENPAIAGWSLTAAAPAPSKPLAWTKQRSDAADCEWSLTAAATPGAPTLRWAKQRGNWVMVRTAS